MDLRSSKPVWGLSRPLAALLLAAALMVACASIPWVEDAVRQEGDEAVVQAQGAGRHRFTLLRSPQTPPWGALTCSNVGPGPLARIRLWGLGGKDLVDLQSPSGEAAQPFALLPSERLNLLASGGNEANRTPMLLGAFGWQWPAAPGQKPFRWPGSVQGASFGADGSVVFQVLPGRESHVEIPFDSPLPIKSLRVGWTGDEDRVPPASPVEIWVGGDAGQWIRAARPAGGDVSHPFEVPAAAGRRSFRLRFAWNQGLGGPAPPTLRQIRVEREFQAPGKLRLFPAGTSEIRFAFGEDEDPGAAEGSMLELRLRSIPAL